MTALLPPNSTPLELALAATIAAQLGALDVPLRELWNPATCPIAFLPYLGWTLGIASWDDSWPDQVKRARVAAAIAIARHNGTEQAVTDIVAAYGGNVTLTKWYDATPPGAPFTFTLTVAVGGQSNTAPSAAFIDAMLADVGRAKGARDSFTFTVSLTAIGAAGVLGAVRPATYRRLELHS